MEGWIPISSAAPPFELGTRTTTDKDTQWTILEWIETKYRKHEPRKWIGIKWLCTYGKIRPDDLRRITEKDVRFIKHPAYGLVAKIVITRPTKRKKSRVLWITPDDAELPATLPRGLSDMPVFRHDLDWPPMVKSGDVFGKDLLYPIWREACYDLDLIQYRDPENKKGPTPTRRCTVEPGTRRPRPCRMKMG